jgi:hypothetical protein
MPDSLVNLRKLGQLKVDGNPLGNLPRTVVGGAAVFNHVVRRVQAKREIGHTR